MKSTFPAFVLTVLLALSATTLMGSNPPKINDLPVSKQLYSISIIATSLIPWGLLLSIACSISSIS